MVKTINQIYIYIYINHDKTYNNHILIVYYKPIRQCFTDIPCFSPPGEGHQTFWPPSLPSFTTCTRTPERMPCQIKCQNILCNTVYILCTYCAHTYTHKHIHTYIHTYIYTYTMHTSRWFVRNYVRKVWPGGDHSKWQVIHGVYWKTGGLNCLLAVVRSTALVTCAFLLALSESRLRKELMA